MLNLEARFPLTPQGMNKARFCRRGLLSTQAPICLWLHAHNFGEHRMLQPNAATVKCPKEQNDISKCLFSLLAAEWHLERCYLMPPGWSQEENSSQSSLLGVCFSMEEGKLAGKTPCTQERLRIATPLFGRGGCSIPAAVLGSSQGLSLKVLHPMSKSFMSPRLA